MRDYFGEMLQTLQDEDELKAYNRGGQLLDDINAEVNWLSEQASHISQLAGYLHVKIGDKSTLTILHKVAKSERPTKIREAAMSLVGKGMSRFDSARVVTELEYMGFSLGVKQPSAVIGTVLSKSKDFRRIDKNLFHFEGSRERLDE